ncbi:MAG: pilus assembly protein [Henriciella sp.]|nr:pilus assembly protein [Henriciella sp.]
MKRTIHHFHWRKIRGFLRANDGVSAVEFALIAPVMMLFYFGSIEVSFMMTLDRKVTSASATLGDLTARAASVNNAELNDIFEATRMVFEPYPIADARMRISSLKEDNGAVKVAWSDGRNLTPYPAGQAITIPPDLISKNGTLIYAEIEYDYESFLGYFFTEKKTLTDEFYLRPRRVNEIERRRN